MLVEKKLHHHPGWRLSTSHSGTLALTRSCDCLGAKGRLTMFHACFWQEQLSNTNCGCYVGCATLGGISVQDGSASAINCLL